VGEIGLRESKVAYARKASVLGDLSAVNDLCDDLVDPDRLAHLFGESSRPP